MFLSIVQKWLQKIVLDPIKGSAENWFLDGKISVTDLADRLKQETSISLYTEPRENKEKMQKGGEGGKSCLSPNSPNKRTGAQVMFSQVNSHNDREAFRVLDGMFARTDLGISIIHEP